MMVLEPPMNSAQRRKLGDITNLQNQNKIVNHGAKQQQQSILVSSKENAENLQKENVRLMKVVWNGKLAFSIQEQTLPCTRHASKVKPIEADHENVSEISTTNSFQIYEKPNNQRCSPRRQSIKCRPEAGEPHDTKEITGVFLRRRSARFNVQELGVTENLNGLHDDQDIAANAGCSASEQSTGSRPEAVQKHDMTETTGKSRVSSRRQSANVKTLRHIKETADPPLMSLVRYRVQVQWRLRRIKEQTSRR